MNRRRNKAGKRRRRQPFLYGRALKQPVHAIGKGPLQPRCVDCGVLLDKSDGGTGQCTHCASMERRRDRAEEQRNAWD
jgi:hypothetical protein